MVYLYLTITAWVILIACFRKNTLINNKYTNNAILVVLFFTVSFSIYNVDADSVPDLQNYADRLVIFSNLPFSQLNLSIANEPLFDILQWSVTKITDSLGVFLIIVWTIIFINITKAVKNLFDSTDVLFVLYSYATFFIFFNYVLNAMRQGLAISFLILALSILISKKKKLSFYLFIIIAPLFHVTALPLSVLLLITRWFRLGMKTVIFGWLISAILYITSYNSALFSGMESRLLDTYTSDYIYTVYSSTNRLDFLIFSVFFAVFALFAWNYILKRDTQYGNLLKYYLLFNAYFLCFGFIAYSDRLAAYSWMLIPILVWKIIPGRVNARYKSIALIVAFLIMAIFTGSVDVILESL